MNAPLWISQIDHCSVLITNLARSRQFYGELLGLREIHKPRTFDFEVLWYDLGDQTLHLLLKNKPDTLSPRHFALRVADAGGRRQRLTEKLSLMPWLSGPPQRPPTQGKVPRTERVRFVLRSKWSV